MFPHQLRQSRKSLTRWMRNDERTQCHGRDGLQDDFHPFLHYQTPLRSDSHSDHARLDSNHITNLARRTFGYLFEHQNLSQ